MAQRNDDELAFYLADLVRTAGHINDQERDWYLSKLAPYTGAMHVNDIWQAYWLSLGIAQGTSNDMAYAWLVSLGIPAGHINDMWHAYFDVGTVMTFTDNFNRPDDGDITTSPNWSTPDAGPVSSAIVNNQIHHISNTSRVYLSPDLGSPNHYAQVLRVSGIDRQYFDVVVRATDGQNYFGVRNNSGVLQLFRKQAGTLTQIGSNVANIPSATDTVRLEVDSNNMFSVLINGILKIGPIQDNFNSTETRQGLSTRSQVASPAIDDYEAGVL